VKGSNSAKAKLQDPGSKLQASNASAARTSNPPTANLSTLNNQPSTAQILGILHKWGVHTLGQLATLNKEDLRTRLGNEAVRLWERANGTAAAAPADGSDAQLWRGRQDRSNLGLDDTDVSVTQNSVGVHVLTEIR
jgi:hypothetical protein